MVAIEQSTCQPSPEKLILAIDCYEYRDSQLLKVQRIRDIRILSPEWDMCITPTRSSQSSGTILEDSEMVDLNETTFSGQERVVVHMKSW